MYSLVYSIDKYFFSSMAEIDGIGPNILDRTQNDDLIHSNRVGNAKLIMEHSLDGMRYRGDSRSHEGHQVTR